MSTHTVDCRSCDWQANNTVPQDEKYTAFYETLYCPYPVFMSFYSLQPGYFSLFSVAWIISQCSHCLQQDKNYMQHILLMRRKSLLLFQSGSQSMPHIAQI